MKSRWLGLCTSLLAFTCTVSASVELEPNLLYSTVNGVELSGDLYRVKADQPTAGIVLVHGGGWRKGHRGQMKSIARQLANDGFVVFNISYRLAPQHPFPAAVHDAKAAVRWLRGNAARHGVDPNRIGIFGYSAGAHLAMMVALTSPADELEGETNNGNTPSHVQAAVGGGTPTDLALFSDNRSTTEFLGGTRTQRPNVYRRASPVHYVSADDPPVFLYHGRSDAVVDIEHAVRLQSALEDTGVPVQLYRGRFGHFYRFLFGGKDVAAASAFLSEHLNR